MNQPRHRSLRSRVGASMRTRQSEKTTFSGLGGRNAGGIRSQFFREKFCGYSYSNIFPLLYSNTVEKPAVVEKERAPQGGTITEHYISLATSDDGESWNLSDEPLVEHASVPETIHLKYSIGEFPENTVLGYFVDVSEFTGPGEEKIGVIASQDAGQTWSETINATLEGAEEHVMVDPSVVQLEDGRIRLHYLDFSKAAGVQGIAGQHTFHSAISEDGVNFTYESEALTAAGITDPEVVYFNSQWVMYYAQPDEGPGSSVRVATSKDGLTFEALDVETYTSGIPGAVIVDEVVHVYGCGLGGIIKNISTDGITFRDTATALFTVEAGSEILCDPAPTRLSDGRYVMLVKRAPAQEPKRGVLNSQTVGPTD